VKALRAVLGTLLAFALAGCAGPVGTDTVPRTSDEDGIRQSNALLERFVREDEPGCSAAVAIHGDLVWEGARGLADGDTGEPLSPESVFDFASVSKQFTAVAILLLAEEATVSLDDTLARWMPGLPRWASTVTLEDLLHHRSGMPDYTALLAEQGVGLTDTATQEDALQAIARVSKLRATPGTVFDYSNSNYVLLAEIVQLATGVEFADFLSQRVFDGHDLRLDPGHESTVTGHEKGKPMVSRWSQYGDGSVAGTPVALALWADYYRTGTIDGVDLTGRTTEDAVPTGAPDGSSYGAGLMVAADGTLSHIGVWAGTVTLFGVTADRSTVIVASCNSTDAPVDPVAQGLRTIWETHE
jgi:CubicO group peptidase (beta-lactamase class C family)